MFDTIVTSSYPRTTLAVICSMLAQVAHAVLLAYHDAVGVRSLIRSLERCYKLLCRASRLMIEAIASATVRLPAKPSSVLA
jgi:hypothetical protein